MGAKDLTDPDFQIGAGCLADQLVGQCMAHALGLGYLADEGHIRSALRAVLRHNFRRGLAGHFNYLRSFALGEESALLVASYPRGRVPRSPFPYASEAWTGLEYTAAAGMIYEGLVSGGHKAMVAEGLKCIAAVRDRHDGRKRDPFDEPECGHHYARAMASWTAIPALTGFHYDGVNGDMTFAAAVVPSSPRARSGRGSSRRSGAAQWFWSTGGAWGVVRQSRPPGKAAGTRRGLKIELEVLGGSLRFRRITVRGVGSAELPDGKTIAGPRTLKLLLES
jgi:hypothetical protein